MKGSYLDNKKMPKEGETVYFLHGFDRKIKKGKIVKITNIDNKGLANTSMDIESNGKIIHTDISQIYDHKPKQVVKKDEYGEVKIWEEVKMTDRLIEKYLGEEKVNWEEFYRMSKDTSGKSFKAYEKKYGGYKFQAPHVRDALKKSKNFKEFMKMLSQFKESTYMNEKWGKKVEIHSTGEHAGKSVSDLEKEIKKLRGKPGNKEKMGELLFALRSKKGWPKGKGSTGLGEATKKTGKSSSSTAMECLECGKKFKKKLTPRTFEVKCPKCGSYDTNVEYY